MADQSRNDAEQQAFEESGDFANYFSTYEFLYHQKQMLEDHRRMGAYHSAIMSNRAAFQGKVVLDVGAGSGILSLWAAQAGARKVYGVEATKVAQQARLLMKCNGVADRVVIIQSEMEKVTLPETVDIIISEWMGYLLLREAMLDSVLYARDHFLKPNGLMFPNTAKLMIAPVSTTEGAEREAECQQALKEWARFVEEARQWYDTDMRCLTSVYHHEQSQYYYHTAQWVNLDGDAVVGDPHCVLHLDLQHATVEDYRTVVATFSCPVRMAGPITGFAGWFSVTFPKTVGAAPPVDLDTAPGSGYTHWGQQLFSFYPPLNTEYGEEFCGTIELSRRPDSQRLLQVEMTYLLRSLYSSNVTSGPMRTRWLLQ